MPKSLLIRYNDAAVILHWLIALLIIGLLGMGKFIHTLADEDPLKFELVQWHKSFGITVLLLVVIRILWRLTYTAPAHPDHAPAWEKLAAKLTHVFLYALMIIMPVSGWLMVSASPLNLDTILFNAINWPHVPGHETLQARELAGRFHEIHEISTGIAIVLVIMHIGAALKHHIMNKDDVLRRMLPDWQSGSFKTRAVTTLIAIVAAVGGLSMLASARQNQPTVVTANNSIINFSTVVAGEQTPGQFLESTINLTLDKNNPANSTLTAEVITASANTDNLQANGSLPDTDWFDSAAHPTASFASTSISQSGVSYKVVGDMTVKGIAKPIEFDLIIDATSTPNTATGQFGIDRFDFNLGTNDQPDEEYVNAVINVDFKFDL